MIRNLVCINCPMGCEMEVELENGQVLSVKGNTCPRGKAYAETEVLHPVRTITTSLPVNGGDLEMVSCKTSHPIPKEDIFTLMKALAGICVQAPVSIGDVLVSSPAGIDVDIISTRVVEKR